MRIVVDAALGGGMPTCLQQLERARARRALRRRRGAAAPPRRAACRSCAPGSASVIGSWKIIAISLPRTSRSSRGAASAGPALEERLAVDRRRALGVEPHHRQARDALARARLADDPERLALARPRSSRRRRPARCRRRCGSRLQVPTSRSGAMSPMQLLAEPDPRVDPRVGDVDDQVRVIIADGREHDDARSRSAGRRS